MGAIVRCAAVQRRIIKALVLREIHSKHSGTALGYLWEFVTPILAVAVLYLVWTILLHRTSSSVPLILFLLTGVLPFWMYRQVMGVVNSAPAQRNHIRALPPITLFDVVYTKVLLETLTMGIVFFILVFATNYIGENPRIQDPLGVIFALGMLGALGAGMGMLITGLKPIIPSIQKLIMALFSRPLFFTSGLFFTADMIPEPMRTYLLYNPILQVIEYLRDSFFYEFDSPYYDFQYIGGFTFCLLALGFATMRINEHRLVTA